MYNYKYPHPAVTVDCVVFGLDDNELKVLLIQRMLEPFKNKWALPGGFIKMDEDLADSALRELKEETGVENLYLEQLGTWGRPERDPRERVITVAYFAIVNLFDHPAKADTDAQDAGWFSIDSLPELAFDHDQILSAALRKLQRKLHYEPLVFEFLPSKFTLSQVQNLYERILRTTVDKRNFRKKLLATESLEALDEYETGVSHRAAQYYVFNRTEWEKKSSEGFEFNVL